MEKEKVDVSKDWYDKHPVVRPVGKFVAPSAKEISTGTSFIQFCMKLMPLDTNTYCYTCDSSVQGGDVLNHLFFGQLQCLHCNARVLSCNKIRNIPQNMCLKSGNDLHTYHKWLSNPVDYITYFIRKDLVIQRFCKNKEGPPNPLDIVNELSNYIGKLSVLKSFMPWEWALHACRDYVISKQGLKERVGKWSLNPATKDFRKPHHSSGIMKFSPVLKDTQLISVSEDDPNDIRIEGIGTSVECGSDSGKVVLSQNSSSAQKIIGKPSESQVKKLISQPINTLVSKATQKEEIVKSRNYTHKLKASQKTELNTVSQVDEVQPQKAKAENFRAVRKVGPTTGENAVKIADHGSSQSSSSAAGSTCVAEVQLSSVAEKQYQESDVHHIRKDIRKLGGNFDQLGNVEDRDTQKSISGRPLELNKKSALTVKDKKLICNVADKEQTDDCKTVNTKSPTGIVVEKSSERFCSKNKVSKERELTSDANSHTQESCSVGEVRKKSNLTLTDRAHTDKRGSGDASAKTGNLAIGKDSQNVNNASGEERPKKRKLSLMEPSSAVKTKENLVEHSSTEDRHIVEAGAEKGISSMDGSLQVENHNSFQVLIKSDNTTSMKSSSGEIKKSVASISNKDNLTSGMNLQVKSRTSVGEVVKQNNSTLTRNSSENRSSVEAVSKEINSIVDGNTQVKNCQVLSELAKGNEGKTNNGTVVDLSAVRSGVPDTSATNSSNYQEFSNSSIAHLLPSQYSYPDDSEIINQTELNYAEIIPEDSNIENLASNVGTHSTILEVSGGIAVQEQEVSIPQPGELEVSPRIERQAKRDNTAVDKVPSKRKRNYLKKRRRREDINRIDEMRFISPAIIKSGHYLIMKHPDQIIPDHCPNCYCELNLSRLSVDCSTFVVNIMCTDCKLKIFIVTELADSVYVPEQAVLNGAV